MKKLIIIFLLLSSVANAQDEQTTIENTQEIKNEIYDKRVSVYLHPLTLICSAILLDKPAFFLYATIEVPLSLSCSLIIKPSYWHNAPDGLLWPDYFDKFGSNIGIRFFPNKETNFFYLQGQAGLFCFSNKNEDYMNFDIMGYLGWVKKKSNFNMFCDIGMGFAPQKTNTMPFIMQASWIFDWNLGIGIPLGKSKK